MGLSLLGAAMMPREGLAQYQVVGPSAARYQALGTEGLPPGTEAISGSSVSLPFEFSYFGLTLTSFTVSGYGYLGIAGSTALDSSNEVIPHLVSSPQSPRAFIAPWWDSLVTMKAKYLWAVTGLAPNRVMIVEWQVPQAATATTNRFQVRLFETTGRIQFSYDTPTFALSSASVGIQSDLGNGLPALSCSVTATCSSANFPSGSVIDFFRPADLEVPTMSAPHLGYAGVVLPAVASVQNSGGRQAANVDVGFYLSSDATFDAGDRLLGISTIEAIEASATTRVISSGVLPSTLTPGDSYFIIAVVDPGGGLAEGNETNNVSVALPFEVGTPTADLVASTLSVEASVQPGATLHARRQIRNTGNAASLGTVVSYFLSDNAVASVADRPLGAVEPLAPLGVASIDSSTVELSLPPDLAEGTYWVGYCVNYDSRSNTFGAAPEITWVNDCITSTPIQVSTATLTVTTTQLSQVAQFAPFSQSLSARGGTGTYTWAVQSGSLPLGVTLSEDGQLAGSPSNAGAFSFTVEVHSGSANATKALTLVVAPGHLPLALADQQLPGAEVGQAYTVAFIAVGGSPPYSWVSDINALAPGLVLTPDGRLEGRPTQQGTVSFVVTVTDSSGVTVSKPRALVVVAPAALTIATTVLTEARLTHAYSQPLVALGGRPPYAWEVERIQRLAQVLTDEPGPEWAHEQVAPALAALGFSLVDTATVDQLQGVARQVGDFTITLKVTDGAGTVDRTTLLLRVTYDEPLVLTTTFLPDAFVNEPYAVKLSHNGGRDAMGVVFSTPCVKRAVGAGQYECVTVDALEQLPAGLSLASDGTLAGTPQTSAGNYAFLVRVADASGRQDVRAIGLRVAPDYKPRGCTSGAGLASGLSLFVVLSVLRRRLVAFALVAVGLTACSSNGSNLCADRNVTCEGSLSCDPSDGACKCGGRGGVFCPDGFSCDPLTKTCQSVRCATKDCSDAPGTSCDAFDGVCKCGGTGGAVCSPAQRCNAATKRCERQDDCRAVGCKLNEQCNAQTGACQCGDTSCAAAQVCALDQHGARLCVDSRCSGVSCTGNTTCDAVDGLCKCNGAVCESGAACSCPAGSDGGCPPSARACRAGQACTGVKCENGTTCDPTDGRCRCGGPGGPACTAEQQCTLRPARCQGGAQCAQADGGPTVCPAGTSCDPEDGVCKCGGQGGLTCAALGDAGVPSVCIELPAQRACRQPCDVRANDCPSGMRCYFDSLATTPAAYCATPSDTSSDESACTTPTACFDVGRASAGHCLGLSIGQTGICHAYCDVAAGTGACVQVPRPHTCLQIPDAPAGFGWCHAM